jgi:hypothetical protein
MEIGDKTAEMEEFIRFNFGVTVVGTYVGLVME